MPFAAPLHETHIVDGRDFERTMLPSGDARTGIGTPKLTYMIS